MKAYACRGRIEECHKALKTGTSIGESQLSTLQRVEAMMAIHAVAAVELLGLKLLCRTHPDAPVPEDFLVPGAFAVLEGLLGRPDKRWTNETLLRAIARLGGYLDCKNDDPGWLSICRGRVTLTILAEGYILAMQHKR